MVMTAWSRPWHTDGINREYRQTVARYQPGQRWKLRVGGVGGYEAAGGGGSQTWTGVRPGSAQIIEGVYQLQNETLGGLIPPTTWPRDATKRAGLHPCTVPVRWTGTAFELPLGEKFVCSAAGPGIKVVD